MRSDHERRTGAVFADEQLNCCKIELGSSVVVKGKREQEESRHLLEMSFSRSQVGTLGLIKTSVELSVLIWIRNLNLQIVPFGAFHIQYRSLL